MTIDPAKATLETQPKLKATYNSLKPKKVKYSTLATTNISNNTHQKLHNRRNLLTS